jgi:hypothetical protein
VRLPGGIIVQWGTTGTVSSGSGSWVSSNASFPISFPTAVLVAVGTLDANASSISSGFVADVLIDLESCSTSTLVAYIRRAAASGDFAINYVAIGY